MPSRNRESRNRHNIISTKSLVGYLLGYIIKTIAGQCCSERVLYQQRNALYDRILRMAEGSNAFRNSLDLPREIHYFASLGLSLILVTDILHSMAFLFRRGICGSFSRIAPLVFSLFPFFSPALAAPRDIATSWKHALHLAPDRWASQMSSTAILRSRDEASIPYCSPRSVSASIRAPIGQQLRPEPSLSSATQRSKPLPTFKPLARGLTLGGWVECNGGRMSQLDRIPYPGEPNSAN